MKGSSGGFVTIESKISSGKCLTLKKELVLYDNKRQPNQLFEMVNSEQGQVYLKCQENGNVLTLKEEFAKDGVGFVGMPYANQPTQKFRIQEFTPGLNEYLIYSCCGKMLDVCEWKNKNDTVVHQWLFNGGDNQLWSIKKV